MHEIDEKDMQILETLRQNSHLSIGRIAKRTGIPSATVHNRIRKLKEQGIIRRYTIDIDMARLGRGMRAFIMVKAVRKADHSELLHKIARHDLILEGAAITGEFDLIFKAAVRDMDELNGLVTGHLRKLDEVAETRTYVAFETVGK